MLHSNVLTKVKLRVKYAFYNHLRNPLMNPASSALSIYYYETDHYIIVGKTSIS